MSVLQMAIGTTVLAGFATVAIQAIEVPKSPQFLDVIKIEQDGETVLPTRRFNVDGNANWKVTISTPGGGSLICWTRPGPVPDQGWSTYEKTTEETITPMSLDDWVGDPGCYSRLTVGQEYKEIATWAPWGPYAPIKYTRTFRR